ncbi:ECF transporter S component [Mycoplasma crocodyli]|uniref:Putative membrane protein n=1 Tax=Mycoplasma crocodyli (strain ATCC 51981 / MP145) TaxID=512564 RepID=D5E5F4_MYCCM|nr:ECF transporter S component [Mycoplasma crocodyli]ADE19798.1 putative membrane protein [Mycoplasma crocodyli MP145]
MKEQINSKIKNTFKLTTMEIAVSGFFIAMILILSVFTKYTAFRLLNLNFKYLFFILFGFFLGWFKGAVLAFIADTLTLMISGSIGYWMWEFSIIPPMISLASSMYFYLVRNVKWFSYIAPNVIVLLAFFMSLLVIILQSKGLKEDGLFTISRTFGINKLSSGIVIGLSILFFGLIILLSVFWIIYFKTRNKRIILYISAFAIVVLVIVIFRWIWHPIAYINYLNYVNNSKPGYALRTYGDFYYFWMANNILKSLITIPIYTSLLIMLIQPFEYLRNRYLVEPLLYQY